MNKLSIKPTQLAAQHNSKEQGYLTLQSQQKVIQGQEKPKLREQEKHVPGRYKKLADCNETKSRLVLFLNKCFNTLNVYGKEPEQLGDSIELMVLCLGEYNWDQLAPAFIICLQKNKTFPTPADIIEVINPAESIPIYCPDVYKEFKKEYRNSGYGYVESWKKDYIKWFESKTAGNIKK